MNDATFLRTLAGAAKTTLAGRARRGPKRPAWSFAYELLATYLQDLDRLIEPLPWEEQRRAWDAASRRTPPVRGVSWTVGDLGRVRGAWARPAAGAEGRRTVLYFHGGAGIFGSLLTHRDLVMRMAAAAQADVFAVDYRLAPEHPFPSAVEDAEAAFEALVARTPASHIAVAGDSAGGNLATALLLARRDARRSLPACAALVCPWVDLAARGGSLDANAPYDWVTPAQVALWSRTYLNGADPRAPLASPLHARLEGLPPLLVQVGGAEMLFDQVTAFIAKARAAGVDVTAPAYPDMIHDWHTLAPFLPEGRRAIDDVGAFVRAHVPA